MPRANSCTVTGLDRYGKTIQFKLSGFHARVFQHEVDYLNGKFLTDRVKNLKPSRNLVNGKNIGRKRNDM
ncbi:peptide deformylase [Candidatus Uhrbacteria bacterium]|nr:peptide deformylase [Candidatus Uhrbacteria bacterium]